MDKCLKQIIWMSWTMRSRALFLNCNKVRNRIYLNSSQNYWNPPREIYRSANLEPVKKIMNESLTMTSDDTKRILDSITDECQTMQLPDIFDVLSIISKIAATEENKFELREYKGFKMLCNRMQEQIRQMTLADVIKSLKFLNYLNVPSNTMIMQSLLHIIKLNLNQLDINQMHLLTVIFKTMKPTPLSSALQLALPMLLQSILINKLDHTDLKELSLALYYVKLTNDQNTYMKIYKDIQSALINDSKPPSVRTLKNIYISLSMLAEQKIYSAENRKTIVMVREALFQNINKMSPLDIEECLKEISKSLIDKRISHSYDATFINELLNVLISKNPSFIISCNIAKYLNSINFVYLPFIEFLTNKILDKEYILGIDAYSIQEILQILSNAQYQSVPWLILESKLLDEKFLNDTPFKALLKCAVHLAALNKFYPKLLMKIFTELDKYLLYSNSGNNVHSKRIIFLYQIVKSLYPYYTGPFPDKIFLQLQNQPFNSKFTTTLRLHMEKTMGGPQYVASNLKTKLGHTINHAVIMRKGGYPMAFNIRDSTILSNCNNYVEDFNYESNVVPILIVAYPYQSYSINTQQLLGVWKSQIMSLEKWTGYKCVAININEWISLPTHEKNTYIMQEIKNKCSDIFELT